MHHSKATSLILHRQPVYGLVCVCVSVQVGERDLAGTLLWSTPPPGILSLSVRIGVYGEAAIMAPQISLCTGERGGQITHDKIKKGGQTLECNMFHIAASQHINMEKCLTSRADYRLKFSDRSADIILYSVM